MSYEDWLDYCFARPVETTQWYWQDNAEGRELDWYQPQPLEIANNLKRLFHECGSLPQRYTLEQINQALWYTCSFPSSYFYDMRHETVPRALLEDVVASTRYLYSDLFGPHCSHFYGHLDRGPEPATPLNSACYMLWDLDGGVDTAIYSGDLVEPAFDALGWALQERNPACIESVLHGLGHFQSNYPTRVAELLEQIRKRHPNLPDELQSYWRAATIGYVL